MNNLNQRLTCTELRNEEIEKEPSGLSYTAYMGIHSPPPRRLQAGGLQIRRPRTSVAIVPNELAYARTSLER